MLFITSIPTVRSVGIDVINNIFAYMHRTLRQRGVFSDCPMGCTKCESVNEAVPVCSECAVDYYLDEESDPVTCKCKYRHFAFF